MRLMSEASGTPKNSGVYSTGPLMIFQSRHSPFQSVVAPAAKTPEGLRIYAIGDIHGRLDLLDRLAGKVRDDLEQRCCDEAVAVFLGDYIDRGPDSSGVAERLAAGDFPTPIVALRGNHEAQLLNCLENGEAIGSWRHYGGLETLVSYAVDVKDVMRGQGYGAARDALRRNLPAKHREFFEQTRLSWSLGDYFFCHAGVRPSAPLAEQDERDLLWIREEFLAHRGPFEKIVVHGHTPAPEPEIEPNRIGIDTGAYATGVLTCLVLEGQTRRFLSTREMEAQSCRAARPMEPRDQE